jgi:hypothetical protein
VRPIYANHLAVGGTVTDFTIYFLELSQMPGGPPKQEVRVAVTMPIALAEGIAQAMKEVTERNLALIKQAAATKSATK